MEFKDKIRDIRELKGWSQAQMARRLGVSASSVALWETGKRVPPINKMKWLADQLGVSFAYLSGEATEYFSESEAEEMAQMLYDRPEIKVLFDCAKDCDKEAILTVASLLEKMK